MPHINPLTYLLTYLQRIFIAHFVQLGKFSLLNVPLREMTFKRFYLTADLFPCIASKGQTEKTLEQINCIFDKARRRIALHSVNRFLCQVDGVNTSNKEGGG